LVVSRQPFWSAVESHSSGRYHFDGQGMIGTTLIAFSGEPFTILELTAT
jgi:hypothetical protein